MELWKQQGWLEQAKLLLDSFEFWLGHALLPRAGNPEDDARKLFQAPFVVVSHGTEADPILNYGNQVALQLWEMEPATFCRTPSRMTAEPMHREERERLLQRTTSEGYVDDYSGIRISSTGQRFLIPRAIVWNLRRSTGEVIGQAATFNCWEFLGEQRSQ